LTNKYSQNNDFFVKEKYTILARDETKAACAEMVFLCHKIKKSVSFSRKLKRNLTNSQEKFCGICYKTRLPRIDFGKNSI